MAKTQMVRKVFDDKGKLIIVEMVAEAKSVGGGCHVLVPKELIGKQVKIEYKENEVYNNE